MEMINKIEGLFYLPKKTIEDFRSLGIVNNGKIYSEDVSNIVTLILVPSERCNLHCKYCYETEKNQASMELSVAKNAIRKAFSDLPKGMKLKIEFRGGEPLMEFDFLKTLIEWVLQEYDRNDYFFYAVTNGTMLDQNMKEWFYKHRNIIKLPLSIDGVKAVHDNNRCNSFELIDREFFLRTWSHPYTYTTIIPENAKYIFDSLSFLLDEGFDVRANIEFALPWTDEEICELAIGMKKLCDYYENKNDKIYLNFLSPHSFFDYEPVPLKERKRLLICNAGKQRSLCTQNGTMLPCHTFVSSAFSHKTAKNKDFFAMLKNQDLNPPECCKCSFFYLCYICVGFSYAYKGDFKWRNWSMCKITRLRALWSSYYWGKKLNNKGMCLKEEEKQFIARILNLYDGENIGKLGRVKI